MSRFEVTDRDGDRFEIYVSVTARPNHRFNKGVIELLPISSLRDSDGSVFVDRSIPGDEPFVVLGVGIGTKDPRPCSVLMTPEDAVLIADELRSVADMAESESAIWGVR